MFLTHDLNSNLSLDRSICLRPLRSDIERNLFHFTIFFQKNIIKINQKKKRKKYQSNDLLPTTAKLYNEKLNRRLKTIIHGAI